MDILIVEDDPIFAVEVEMMLSKLGFQNVRIVDNGQAAIDAIGEQKPDLLLLDIFLKGEMTGIDVAAYIKQEGIPTIFMTISEDSNTYKSAQEQQPLLYLVKPFNILSLQSAIEAYQGVKIADEATVAENSFFVKQNNEHIKVHYKDIYWIQSEGNYCIIKTGFTRYVLKTSLIRFYERLPKSLFIRVHRNYIVQISEVEKINVADNEISVFNTAIPLGGKYKASVVKCLNL